MKTVLYTIFALFLVLPLTAQQLPQLINYAYSPAFYNPAYKATQKGESGVLYSKQMAAFGAESPSTYLLNADASTLIGIDNLGLGLRLIGDKAHILKSTNITFDFAYNLIPEDDMMLALGLTAGVTNQRFDFTDRFLNDAASAALVPTDVSSKFQFDGGPALYAKFKGLSLSAVLPRLFTSNVVIEEDLLLDLNPHWIGTLSYRYDSDSGFGIEPILFGKGIFTDRECDCKTDISANLRGIYQVDGVDRFWAALGYRLNGAFNLALGAGATEALFILGAFEYRADVGLSFEVGATYALGEIEKPDDPTKDKTPKGTKTTLSPTEETQLLTNKTTVNSQMIGINDIKSTAMVNLNLAEQLYNDARNSNDSDVKRSKTSTALEYLDQAEAAIQQYKIKADIIFDARQSSEDILSSHNLEKHKNIREVREDANQVNESLRSMQDRYSTLDKNINNLAAAIGLDKIDWKSRSNTYLISQLQLKLEKVSNKPAGTAPVQVEGTGADASIIYYFPYDSESYQLSGEPTLQAMAVHIEEIIAAMRADGVTPQSIEVIGRLPIPKAGLIVPQSQSYDGSFNNLLTVEYPFEDLISGETQVEKLTVRKGDGLNLGQLSVLQAYSLKDYLATKGIFPRNLINLQLRAPEDVEYGLEIEVRINYLR